MNELMENIISKLEDEANEAKCLWDDGDYYIGKANAFESAIEIVKEYNNGWIPVSERLPEEDEYVLCQGKNDLFIACIDSLDDKWKDDHFVIRRNVIAWQPLPTPYVEGSE